MKVHGNSRNEKWTKTEHTDIFKKNVDSVRTSAYKNLNNCITSLNNLLTADFNLVEATAFSSGAANFVNIIGS